MIRITPALVAAMVAIGMLLAFPAAGLAQETDDGANETEPGAQLSGVVAVGEAELDGEIQDRAYGIEIASANTDDAKAEVVKNRLDAIEQRLGELEDRKDELDEARENGSMSEGEYRANVAAVHAETKAAERLVDRSNATAGELPEDVLSDNGVNVSAIQTLKDRASELGGPETAEIARSIAGERVGEPPSPDEAGDRGGDADEQPDDADGQDGTPDGGEYPTGNGTEYDVDTNNTENADSADETGGY